MNNMDLIGAIMKTAKKFGPGGPGGPMGGPGGPGGGPGAGGPPAEKKFILMLNLMQPDQPVPLIGRICGMNPPVAIETAKGYEEKGLVTIKESNEGGRPEMLVTITDEGKAVLEAERAEHMKEMEERRKQHIAECDVRLNALTDEEKETLAALLAKIPD